MLMLVVRLWQVQLAASEALKRMQVADVERNAILDTFR